jgi:hypothetical protein
MACSAVGTCVLGHIACPLKMLLMGRASKLGNDEPSKATKFWVPLKRTKFCAAFKYKQSALIVCSKGPSIVKQQPEGVILHGHT